jgi:hypothetical protein
LQVEKLISTNYPLWPEKDEKHPQELKKEKKPDAEKPLKRCAVLQKDMPPGKWRRDLALRSTVVVKENDCST